MFKYVLLIVISVLISLGFYFWLLSSFNQKPVQNVIETKHKVHYQDVPSFADVVKDTTPSVVNIYTFQRNRGYSRNPFLRQRPLKRGSALGSGVIIDSNGTIVTNHHIINKADDIRVTLHNGKTVKAKVIGGDPESDIGVIKIPGQGYDALSFASQKSIQDGDIVLAIGNPYGIGQTVTQGIISEAGRANTGITVFGNMIQTDAAINPGNSGGALVNLNGNLVGINTAILSRSGGYQGIAFAIPSYRVKRLVNLILKHGDVPRGYLGVTLAQGINKKIGAKEAVLIRNVVKGSPAYKAGLRPGDQILAVNGKKVGNTQEVLNLIGTMLPSDSVKLKVKHQNGKTESYDIPLTKRPDFPIRRR